MTTPPTNSPFQVQALLEHVRAAEAKRAAGARAAYRQLLFDLAQKREGELTADPDRVMNLLREVGKSAEQFQADVSHLTRLHELSRVAQEVDERTRLEREAFRAMRAEQEALERTVNEAKERVKESERLRDIAYSRRSQSAQAGEELLRELHVSESYGRLLNQMCRERDRISCTHDQEVRAEAQSEIDRWSGKAREVFRAAMGLESYDPFYEPPAPEQLTSSVPYHEGCDWLVTS